MRQKPDRSALQLVLIGSCDLLLFVIVFQVSDSTVTVTVLIIIGFCDYHILIPSYRVTLMVTDLGWVDFDIYVPSSCLATLPALPNSLLPQHNLADSGISKIKSTQPRSATTSVALYM